MFGFGPTGLEKPFDAAQMIKDELKHRENAVKRLDGEIAQLEKQIVETRAKRDEIAADAERVRAALAQFAPAEPEKQTVHAG